MDAVLLARVSTKEQEETGHSLAAQTKKLREYAQRKGFNVIQEYSFSETAGQKIRKKFEKVIGFLLKQKVIPVLVVMNVDRATRNFRDAVDLDDMRINKGLEIHFVQDGFVLNNQSSGAELFMWEAKVFIAKQYLNRLSDDAHRGIKYKLENGECVTRAPLGYLNVKDGADRSVVVLDDERAHLVKKLFETYANGTCSIAELSRMSAKWGLQTREGHKLSPQVLHRIIEDPFYYGMMNVRNELYPHKYPALISKEMYDICQNIKEGRGRNQATTQTKYPFLFRGMIKCAVSGRQVTCDLKKGKYVYLMCRDPQAPEKKSCVKESIILDQVKEVFRSFQLPEDVIAEIHAYLKQSHESEKNFHYASIEKLRKEKTVLAKRLDTALDHFLDKNITKDDYDRKHAQIMERQHEINALLERHEEGDEQFKMALTTLISLASRAYELFESSNTDEKRQLMAFMFSNLEMEGAKLRYALHSPFHLFVNLGDNQVWRAREDSNSRPSDP